jgi:hypothetical protein
VVFFLLEFGLLYTGSLAVLLLAAEPPGQEIPERWGESPMVFHGGDGGEGRGRIRSFLPTPFEPPVRLFFEARAEDESHGPAGGSHVEEAE